MKYGETLFDIAYLVIAISIGVYLLAKAEGKLQTLMGAAALVLGCGDAFHLVPRVLNYFADRDFTAALGVGKLVTSVTMTVFYILMYYVYLNYYNVSENKSITVCVWCLSTFRIALCLFPQNQWMTDNSPFLWGILRNIPFVLLGIVIICLYFRKKKDGSCFRNLWLYITLSFLFYVPVVVGAEAVPMLGMLMLPKTVCYLLILFAFLQNRNVKTD